MRVPNGIHAVGLRLHSFAAKSIGAGRVVPDARPPRAVECIFERAQVATLGSTESLQPHLRSNLRRIAGVLITISGVWAVPAPAADAARPNVLFIALDDLRPELGCYGRPHVISPNLDQLAAGGTIFTRAYCQIAVCNASRSSLMTGLRPDSTGVVDNETHFRKKAPHIATLPQHFRDSGYHTQSLGKLYHGAFEKAAMGRRFDDPASWSAPPWFASPRYYYTEDGVKVARQTFARRFKKQGAEVDGWTEQMVQALMTEAPDVDDSVLYDGEMTGHAMRLLHAYKLRQGSNTGERVPFFLAVGYLKPHLPFVAPRKYWDLYKPEAIDLPKNPQPPAGAPAEALHRMGEMRAYADFPRNELPLPDDLARKLRHGYLACISYVDAQIGRLLRELGRLGLDRDTIVIVWGDHGYHLGEHGHWGKQTNFENDTRAPLIVRVPGGMGAGARVNALVEFVDIYPSLCELTGLSLPRHLEGTSFVPLLREPQRPWKSAAFSQYPRADLMGYTMRTESHRFTIWQEAAAPDRVHAMELYDHRTDPDETLNLAVQPAHAALVSNLTARLRAGWRAAQPGR